MHICRQLAFIGLLLSKPVLAAAIPADSLVFYQLKAKELLRLMDAHNAGFKSVKNVAKWKDVRGKIKSDLAKSLNEALNHARDEADMSMHGFMSGPFGASLFVREVLSFDLKQHTREDALLENIYLEDFAEELQRNNNFNPYVWEISADDWANVEENLFEIAKFVNTSEIKVAVQPSSGTDEDETPALNESEDSVEKSKETSLKPKKDRTRLLAQASGDQIMEGSIRIWRKDSHPHQNNPPLPAEEAAQACLPRPGQTAY